VSKSLYTIGELARRTGLPVKRIRFYSDLGIVPPAERSRAGYRLYDLDALARLDLVRTLRELGVDLDTIQRVLAREISLPEVAAAHAAALDAQIETLRLRRAIVRAVAKRGSSPQEMELMHKLAQLSDEERRRIIGDFIDATFGGLDADPDFIAKMRSAIPKLPDDPAPEQVAAWVELAELVQDPDFRAAVRRMAEYQAEYQAEGQAAQPAGGKKPGRHGELITAVREKIEAALAAGIDPASERAEPVVADVVAEYVRTFGGADGPDFRRRLLERLEVGSDPRAERYWQLLAIINGWPVQSSLMPIFDWLFAAFRARDARDLRSHDPRFATLDQYLNVRAARIVAHGNL
jgi:DNA-binding transcriptional MerR regulator